MVNSIHDIMLRANTALFAQSMCNTIRDFTGYTFEISASSLQKGLYQSGGTLAAFMHFVSSVQGDFIMTTERTFLNELFSALQSKDEHTGVPDFEEMVSELLNVAVGATLPELEKRLGLVTLMPPAIVNGTIRFPSILSGNVDIKHKEHFIRCTLSINLAHLRNASQSKAL